MDAELVHAGGGASHIVGIPVPERWAEATTTTERISGPSSENSVPLGSSNRKQLIVRGRSKLRVGFSLSWKAWASEGERKRGSAPVSRAYWQTLAPLMPT